MVWSIELSNGKKLQIIQQLMDIKASLDSRRLNANQYFPINSKMRYETVIDWVRKLAHQAWFGSDYRGVHKKHKNLFHKVNSNCNWAHHTDNDPEHRYTAEDGNQQQLVDDLKLLLTQLGVLTAAADDAADALTSAMQAMHV
jgi:hypothetical protein